MTERSDDLNIVSDRLFEQVLRDAVTVWNRAAVFEHAGRCFHQLPPKGSGIKVKLCTSRSPGNAIIGVAQP